MRSFAEFTKNIVHIKSNSEKNQKKEPFTNYVRFTKKRNLADSIDNELRELFLVSSPVMVSIKLK